MSSGLLLIAGLGLLLWGGEILVRGAAGLARSSGLPPLAIGLTVVALGTSAPEVAAAVAAAAQDKGDLVFDNVAGSNLFNTLVILGSAALLAPLVVPQSLARLDVPLMAAASLLAAFFLRDAQLSRGEGLILLLALAAYLAWTFRSVPPQAPPLEAEAALHMGKGRAWAYIALGLLGLVWGAEWLVQGAVAIARAWGVSELLIGLTIIAAGTSAPELVATLVATRHGEREIAVGNVVGSNLFNLLGVLGAGAVTGAQGIHISAQALRVDLPVLIAVTLACVPIFFSGYQVKRWEGALLLSGYLAYSGYLLLDALQSPWMGAYRSGMLWGYLPAVGLALGWAGWKAWGERKEA